MTPAKQSRGNAAGEIGDVGPAAGTQGLSDPCGGPIDITRRADKGHDVADIDPRLRRQRDFLSHARQRPQKNAARVVAHARGDLLQRAAMKMAVIDQNVEDVAWHRARDLVGVDLSPDHRLGGHDGGGRPGKADVVTGFEHDIRPRLDIGATSNDPLDHGAAADLVLDGLDGPAGRGRNAIGAHLEFSIGEVFGFWRGAARKLRFEF